MGGDFAPQINIDGTLKALQDFPAAKILLVGDEPQLKDLLGKSSTSIPAEISQRIEIVPAEGFVGMEEKPMEALLKKPNSSIINCWKLMAAKQADSIISAGNTGGVVAAGLRTRLFLPKVKRPGIAVVLPTLKGKAVLMDVGANPAARPEHLAQYGVMGSVYARKILGIEKPRVGIMNIGSEDGKGIELVREAKDMLANGPIKNLFIGNVEGRDLYQGGADVIIVEGFLGNVILKVSEGMADMMLKTAAHYITGSLNEEKQLAQQAFQKLAHKYQYSETGGAPLLGIDGICLISHGSSDGKSIYNAIRVAHEFHEKNINQDIIDTLCTEK